MQGGAVYQNGAAYQTTTQYANSGSAGYTVEQPAQQVTYTTTTGGYAANSGSGYVQSGSGAGYAASSGAGYTIEQPAQQVTYTTTTQQVPSSTVYETGPVHTTY